MSDAVFEVVTSFGDVAELGQGYINRADGERILLPLPVECAIGEGVRFIVHLADGTPAFAGAGRCVQASDQGPAAAEGRYETLLDSLAFDDRSRPVYEYVVAVRQAVYAAGGPPATEAGAAQPVDAAAEAAAEAEAVAEAEAMADAGVASEAIYAEESGDASPDEATSFMVGAYTATATASATEGEYMVSDSAAGGSEGAEASVDLGADVERIVSVRPSRPVSAAPVAVASDYVEEELPPPPNPSDFVIAPVPRGMLQRASVAAHWQPVAPEPPRPSKKSGLFRYPPGSLPVPAAPPRPELDRSLVVQPAPSPRASMRP